MQSTTHDTLFDDIMIPQLLLIISKIVNDIYKYYRDGQVNIHDKHHMNWTNKKPCKRNKNECLMSHVRVLRTVQKLYLFLACW